PPLNSRKNPIPINRAVSIKPNPYRWRPAAIDGRRPGLGGQAGRIGTDQSDLSFFCNRFRGNDEDCA
ncbi:MAG: hypothetical protein PVG19_09710, partial [Desulfobacterales bacterium]